MRRRASASAAFLISGAALALAPCMASGQATTSPPPSELLALSDPPPPERALASWDELLGLLSTRAPELLRERQTVVRADAQVDLARASVLPTLTAQSGFTHQLITSQQVLGTTSITIPAQDVAAASATAVLPVIDARGWYAVASAKTSVSAARESLAELQRALTQRAVTALLEAVVAERIAELNRVSAQAARERLALTETRLQLGGGTELDVDRAAQDLAATRILLIEGDEALRKAREALGQLLGDPRGIGPAATFDLAGLVRAVAARCELSGDIAQHPDVAAAETRLRVAQRLRTEVRLRHAPTLAVDSQLAWGSGVLYGPKGTWFVRAFVQVSLWDGGARRALARDASAALAQAKSTLALTRQKVLVSLAQAARAVVVSAAARDVAEEQRTLALRIDGRTRTGYARGHGTSLDLTASAQALRQAELNLAVLEVEAILASALATLSNARCAL